MNRILTNYFINFIIKNLSISEEEIIKIEYGLDVLFINILKLIILFSTAWLIKIFNYTLVAFLSFACLRIFASGVHAKSSFMCVVVNYFVFLGNVFFSTNIKYQLLLTLLIYLVSFILIILFAPSDTEKKPIISSSLRKQLKAKSIICISILGAITTIITNPIYKNIISFSIIEGAFMTTPLSYYIFKQRRNNFKKLKGN